jgi:nucleoid-associated protein YgaU
MLNLTTPIKIALAAACLVIVAIIIAVDVARTRGKEETSPMPAVSTSAAEALPPAFQPPKPLVSTPGRASTDPVICPSPAAPELPKPPAAEPVKPKPEEPPKTYTVVPGDNLYGISQKLFGTARHVERIYQANRDRIKDPNTLQIGINLRVPEIAAQPAR